MLTAMTGTDSVTNKYYTVPAFKEHVTYGRERKILGDKSNMM